MILHHPTIGIVLLIWTVIACLFRYSSGTHTPASIQRESLLIDRVTVLIQWISALQKIESSSLALVTSSNDLKDTWMKSFSRTNIAMITGRIKSYETSKPVFTVFLENDGTDADNAATRILQWIELYSNRRNDLFIFVAEELTISRLWAKHKLNQIGNRWGYALDSGQYIGRMEGRPCEVIHVNYVNQLPSRIPVFAGNIGGRHLKLSGWAHVPPYHFISETTKNGQLVFDGTNVRIFKESSSIFNFTYEIYSDEAAASYGQLLENGSWTGMIGAVYSGEYDIVIYLGPSLLWYPMFDFVGVLSGAGIKFLTTKPISELKWQAFLHPFRLSLWLTLLVVFLVVLVLVLTLMKWTSFKIQDEGGNLRILLLSAFLTFQIAMEQNSRIPEGVRMVCGSWVLFSIIIGTAYKSQVMSSLTFPFTEQPPSTYQELASHKDYKSYLNNIGGLEAAYFRSNESQLIIMIAKSLTFEPTPIKCIEKSVVNPKTVCIGWCPFLEYVMAERASPDVKVSPFIVSPDIVMQVAVSVAFQKRSPLSEGFTKIVSSFWESGIYGVWENDVHHIHKRKGVENFQKNPNTLMNSRLKAVIDDISSGNEEKPLKISNLQMMFALLAIGVVLSTVTFAGEQIFYQAGTWTVEPFLIEFVVVKSEIS